MRGNIFANLENEFKYKSEAEITNTVINSVSNLFSDCEKYSVFDENPGFLACTAANIGVSCQTGQLNNKEKRLADAVFGNLWSGSKEILYQALAEPVTDRKFEFVETICNEPQLYTLAMSYLYIILGFAYIDGVADDDVLGRLESIYFLPLMKSFAESGLEEVPTPKRRLQLSSLESRILRYFQENAEGGVPKSDVIDYFEDELSRDVEKALDHLVELGVLIGGDNFINSLYFYNPNDEIEILETMEEDSYEDNPEEEDMSDDDSRVEIWKEEIIKVLSEQGRKTFKQFLKLYGSSVDQENVLSSFQELTDEKIIRVIASRGHTYYELNENDGDNSEDNLSVEKSQSGDFASDTSKKEERDIIQFNEGKEYRGKNYSFIIPDGFSIETNIPEPNNTEMLSRITGIPARELKRDFVVWKPREPYPKDWDYSEIMIMSGPMTSNTSLGNPDDAYEKVRDNFIQMQSTMNLDSKVVYKKYCKNGVSGGYIRQKPVGEGYNYHCILGQNNAFQFRVLFNKSYSVSKMDSAVLAWMDTFHFGDSNNTSQEEDSGNSGDNVSQESVPNNDGEIKKQNICNLLKHSHNYMSFTEISEYSGLAGTELHTILSELVNEGKVFNKFEDGVSEYYYVGEINTNKYAVETDGNSSVVGTLGQTNEKEDYTKEQYIGLSDNGNDNNKINDNMNSPKNGKKGSVLQQQSLGEKKTTKTRNQSISIKKTLSIIIGAIIIAAVIGLCILSVYNAETAHTYVNYTRMGVGIFLLIAAFFLVPLGFIFTEGFSGPIGGIAIGIGGILLGIGSTESKDAANGSAALVVFGLMLVCFGTISLVVGNIIYKFREYKLLQ